LIYGGKIALLILGGCFVGFIGTDGGYHPKEKKMLNKVGAK